MKRVIVILQFLSAACGNDTAAKIDDSDADARKTYPDLNALYTGEHGLYRGCGPNGGVCHNGNEFPNLDSMGSILGNIDIPCNQKRDTGTEFDDLCERKGDRMQFGSEKIEIGYIEPYMDMPNVAWRVVLRKKPDSMTVTPDFMQVWREIPDGAGNFVDTMFVPFAGAIQGFLVDPDDASGKSILVGMVQNNDPFRDLVVQFLTESGTPRPDRFQFGDPNRNATYGADLGGRLIKPGDPDKSYLLRRLTDPHAGPLMPRANCCSWTKTSLRALWCWVDGLEPDGSNAMAPIDYDNCRPSPPVELLYPEPGPMCEAQGLCPVEAAGGTGDASFGSIYSEILTRRCAGNGCHDTATPGGVDLRTKGAAYDTLYARLVPGDPDASVAYQRLDPTLCNGACKTMPLDRPVLSAVELTRIRQWILDGAPED